MDVVISIGEMRRVSRRLRRDARTLGLVPTMGALHEGHRSLVRAARASCDAVAVSLFVNPLQFGPNEDYARYPRALDADRSMLEVEGVDVLFAPGEKEMYPGTKQTWVDVPEIGSRLDGASRPGHFRGVATVVSKLFHIVEPDRAFFGQKDAAQVAVLRRMVRDLDFGVQLVVCPTVRDHDGLALSSRNRYLSAAERQTALVLSRSLREVERARWDGEQSVEVLTRLLRKELQKNTDLRVDYADLVDPETLETIADLHRGALVAVAGWVGGTRLIDNVLLSPDGADA